MLKIFTRFVRESLERKLINKKENVDTATRNKKCCLYKNSFKRVNTNLNAEQKYSSNENETWKTSNCLNQSSWIEAIGLSGTLAISCVLGQHFHARKRKIPKDFVNLYPNNKCTFKNVLSTHRIFKKILPKHVLAQPNDIINVKSIVCPKISKHTLGLPVFGPQSAEETLNEASEGLKRAHNAAVGELENRLGLRCMSKKRYRKAVIHFSAGCALKNSSATFNLAQCYELGFGITRDYVKAAKFYNTASELGNSSAMYNLSVFYAHGMGGLKCDKKKALQLMEKAAELGEPNAKLLFESRSVTNNNNNNKSDQINIKNSSEQKSAEDMTYVVNSLKKSHLETYQLPYSKNLFNSVAADESNMCDVQYSPVSRNSVLFSNFDYDKSSANYYSAICYENGFGVKQNLNKAIEKFSMAAVNGRSEALYNLAACYEITAASLDKTDLTYQVPLLMELYKMAAVHGHYYAIERLKTLEIYEILDTLKDHLINSSKANNLALLSR